MKCSIRSVLLVLGVLGLPLLLHARPAAAAVPDVWAFAYSDTLAPAPGSVLNPAYQWGTFKTSCPGSAATVTRTSMGRYTVVFPCSSGGRGIAHVTAVDNNARYCELEKWQDAGTAKTVSVACFKGPSLEDAKFTVAYTRSSGTTSSGAHAYVSSDPSGVLLDSYNSSGAANSITPLSTGRYQVKLTGLSTGTYDGDLQATAAHPNLAPRRCKIENWFTSGADYLAVVVCADHGGALTNTWFTLSYHFKRAVVGTTPARLAYQTNLVGAPAGSSYNSLGLLNSFTATPPGRYTMRQNGVAAGISHMQVTALAGANGFYCQLEAVWTTVGGDVLAPVICFNNVGTPVDHLAFTTYATP